MKEYEVDEIGDIEAYEINKTDKIKIGDIKAYEINKIDIEARIIKTKYIRNKQRQIQKIKYIYKKIKKTYIYTIKKNL
jgi:hypothetical protein